MPIFCMALDLYLSIPFFTTLLLPRPPRAAVPAEGGVGHQEDAPGSSDR
jgi:hypothetical protein